MNRGFCWFIRLLVLNVWPHWSPLQPPLCIKKQTGNFFLGRINSWEGEQLLLKNSLREGSLVLIPRSVKNQLVLFTKTTDEFEMNVFFMLQLNTFLDSFFLFLCNHSACSPALVRFTQNQLVGVRETSSVGLKYMFWLPQKTIQPPCKL